ncbi:type I polyketide synthase [Streptomyces uncialis]|uniref:type I polyketide synthase n=1 Tax=Streptomyces uncialis TaxID=1048205 RepID=UPI003867CA6F|nr:acyltransferase domain-containing protein [Streptomyces uncialis]
MTERHDDEGPDPRFSVAVIGLAGRFPGADGTGELWRSLLAGDEGITVLDEAEHLAAGGDPALLDDPYHVRAVAEIAGLDRFDAEFFGCSPAEAALLDPQQRMFLEVAHHAFEDSGYPPGGHPGAVGVYAGSGPSRYFTTNLAPWYAGRPGSLDHTAALSANSAGTLPTRVSYLMGLTGPSISVATACSTSLVAVHLACQDLLAQRCDLALAGGVALNPHARLGYRYVQDGPYSPDGKVRAFDRRAAGMLQGDGAGVVVLKRLADALADGDTVRAVVLGSAVNNDGDRKIGFTAPSTTGQTEVIVSALLEAGVSPASIGYVEAHGTGTPVGDPIELTALHDAFERAGGHPGGCAIGSVKTNIGHLDAAAGVAGLIKTVLALEHGTIPPTLHLDEPTELFDWAASPFEPAVTARPWRVPGPRRAGVSSFGIGGTNAHVVLEQPPSAPPSAPGREHTLLTISARTPAALDETARLLGERLAAGPAPRLDDIGHTLAAGRTAHPYRRALVVRSTDEAATRLRETIGAAAEPARQRPVALLLPGGGVHYDGMGRGLYATEPVYRETIDRCAGILRPVLGRDIRDALLAEAAASRDGGEHTALLDGTATGHRAASFPALVATEYALARVLEQRYGVTPVALLGHSLGEYTAACLAGVIALEDVLPLVAERERLFASVGGTSLSVRRGEDAVTPFLAPGLAVAAVNGPDACTVSGRTDAVIALEARLTAAGVDHHRLRVPVAVHSPVLDPVLPEFRDLVAGIRLSKPRVPYLSNVTGTWITEEEATDPEYWVRHSRRTVRFADALRTLGDAARPPVLLEAGPGGGLGKLARTVLGPRVPVVAALRHAYAEQDDGSFLLGALGALWCAGAGPDLPALWRGTRPRRVPLPGYPFARSRFWIDPPGGGPVSGGPVPSYTPADGGSPPVAAVGTRSRSGPPDDSPLGRVTRLWEESLGVTGIAPDQNFFDLGGDSMLLMRLTGQVRDALGVDLSVRRLYVGDRLTVAGFLAEAAEAGLTGTGPTGTGPTGTGPADAGTPAGEAAGQSPPADSPTPSPDPSAAATAAPPNGQDEE